MNFIKKETSYTISFGDTFYLSHEDIYLNDKLKNSKISYNDKIFLKE